MNFQERAFESQNPVSPNYFIQHSSRWSQPLDAFTFGNILIGFRGFIDDYSDTLQTLHHLLDNRAHLSPYKSTIATAKRRKCDRADRVFADKPYQIIQPALDPFHLRRSAPVLLCRKIHDPFRAPHDIAPFRREHMPDFHFLAVRMHPKATAATRNRNVLRPAVTILHHSASAGLCDWIRVKTFKEARPVTRALDPAAAAALIKASEPGPQRLLLTWLFFQGARISATLALDWDQIDLHAKTVKLFNAKGDRWETFPLHDATLAELGPQSEGRVFPWSNRSSLRRWLPQLCARVGVEFTPHMGRHTLGTMMAANGETLRAIMAALGHTTPSSSIRYQGADIEMVRAATGRVTLPLGAEIAGKAMF